MILLVSKEFFFYINFTYVMKCESILKTDNI